MQPAHKLRVVIDTNVWLSGLVFGGKPGQVLQLFIDDTVVVVTSEELLSELRRKITQKFPLFLPKLALLEASLREDASLVQLGGSPVSASRDQDDTMFLETAVIGAVDYLVSGDSDLPVLENYEGIPIVKPAEFLKRMLHI